MSLKTEIKAILNATELDTPVVVKGWVKNCRGNSYVMFAAVNDGSTLQNLQIVFDTAKFNENDLKKITVGCSLSVNGILKASEGKGQRVEIVAESFEVLGACDPDKYPIQPKKHSLEFLRENAHLRFRTNLFGAIMRVRHNMIYAIHTFFTERGFYNIHTPIITASDCEGAGEMFQVTTLDLNNLPKTEDGAVDYSEDFFGKMANLTVSGQLEVELACMALSKVYTFGPTFRAENSNTTRHLAEFWMIEPEIAFADINDDMDIAEEFLKYLIQYALDHCREDLEFLQERLIQEEKSKPESERSMPLIEKLQFVLANDFQRLTYTEAIDILKNSKPNQKGQFKYKIEGFGADLQSEHERYLVEKHFKKPVILTGYPKEIKAFYMKQNPDGKTVAAADILVPKIGEIIGGSQREEDYEKLLTRMKELNMDIDTYKWYLDLRKFGSVPHAGFGLGFERLVMMATGIENIRDVIPYPRFPGHADF